MWGNSDSGGLLLSRSRGVVERGDALAEMLQRGARADIDQALDDLVDAYDQYTGQAASSSRRFALDEQAAVATPAARAEQIDDALATVLIDLDVAVLLGQAAQATSEPDQEEHAARLDEAVSVLNQTLQAFEDADTATGGKRFAFDDEPPLPPMVEANAELDAVRDQYEVQVGQFYDALVSASTSVLQGAFADLTGLDAKNVEAALDMAVGPSASLPGDRLARRIVEAALRAIDGLRNLLRSGALESIRSRAQELLDKLRAGQLGVEQWLKYSYGYDTGRGTIRDWLNTTAAPSARIVVGSQEIRNLHQQMAQSFAVLRRISEALHRLVTPARWLLKRIGGTAPLDLVVACGHLLVMDVAVLRGMDYADTTHLVRFVDGVLTYAQRALNTPAATPRQL